MQSQPAATPPATRIARAFERARHERRSALIPYFMSGYPSATRSVELVRAAIAGGADIVELGMPFSDPLADGATVQHAGHIALERGMSIKGCMEVARQVSADNETPLILMGYYNPVIAYGIERFCQDAANSGVSGLIIPDLPHEEAQPLQQHAGQHGLALSFLIPPTASDERIHHIVQLAARGERGFIYCVSLSGVTGSRATLPPHLRDFVARVRNEAQPAGLPIAIGFGLSTPAHIAEIGQYADGAAVGSAIIHIIDQHAEDTPEAQNEAMRAYVASLVRGGKKGT